MPVQQHNPMTSASGFDPSQLADIHLPEAVSHWPAPGWWISLLLILTLITALWLWKKQRNKNPAIIEARKLKRLKTEAQRELDRLEQQFKEQQNAHQSVELLSVFLRRLVLSLYKREQVASLTNEQWLELLDQLSAGQDFSSRFKYLLLEAPYQSPDTAIDSELLEQLFLATRTLLDKVIQKKTIRKKAIRKKVKQKRGSGDHHV